MLKYDNNTENLRIFNRKKIETIENLTIAINKQLFNGIIESINNRYIIFNIENLLILPPTTYEYQIIADDQLIDVGLINIS